jgi:tetratricopeptide (TPR) repeat protein
MSKHKQVLTLKLAHLTVFLSFWGVFWIDASSHESAKHHYSKIAKIGEVEPNVASAKNWLSSQERPWLLLIDNADDPEMPIEEYFPEGERGLILVTTRNPSYKVHGTVGSRFYHFEKLGTEEANDLLLAAACEPSPYKASSRESAALIAKELGCLPLALVHAGKAIRHHRCSLGNYLNFYKRHWQKLRLARIKDTSMIVYSVFEVTYQPFEEKTTEGAKDAVELLKMFSFFNCEDIRVEYLVQAVNNSRLEQEQEMSQKHTTTSNTKPKSWQGYLRELMMGLLDVYIKYQNRPVLPRVLRYSGADISSEDQQDRLRVALDLLSQMSFITYNEMTESYFMHPLVHTWARERPGMSTGEQAIWCEAAITTLAQCILLPPLGSATADEALRRDLLPHLNHVQHYQAEICKKIVYEQSKRMRPWPVLAPKLDRQRALVLAKFSRVYYQCGIYNEAEQLQQKVKNFVCPRLGMEHPKAQAIVLALSSTLWQQSRFKEAENLQNEVLQARLSSLGPDHPDTLKAMDILGASHCHLGRWKESEDLHQKAITGMIQVLGSEHRDYLIAVYNLGNLMFMLFRFEESRELHLKALAGMKRVFGSNHLQTLECMENLSMASTEIGGELLNPAYDMIGEVVQQRRKILGKESPWTLQAVLSCSKVMLALGQMMEAEVILRAAIPVAVRTLGDDHFGTLAGREFLAQILVRQERYGEAEEIFTDVIERHRRSPVADQYGHHPDLIMAMYHLMGCYQKQKMLKDAFRICDELTKILERRKSTHKFFGWVKKAREDLEAARSPSAAESPVVEQSPDTGLAVAAVEGE